MRKTCFHILISFAVTVIAAATCYSQQHAQFTQYMFNNALINPAYAGADEALNLTFIQRNQWSGVENAPTTQTLSAHTLFKKRNVGVGLSLINDEIGVHKNMNALAQYAYHLKLGAECYLSAGLQAGVVSKKSDYTSLLGNSPDPKLSNPSFQHTFFDVGMGVYFRSQKLHAGISIPQMLPARMLVGDSLELQFNKANYLLFSKYIMQLNDNFDLEPSFLFKYLPGVPLSVDLNMNVVFRKAITMGVSYRKQESFDFLFKGQITQQLQFGYSYDYPIDHISQLTNGSHEFMVQYVFRYLQKNVTSPR